MFSVHPGPCRVTGGVRLAGAAVAVNPGDMFDLKSKVIALYPFMHGWREHNAGVLMPRNSRIAKNMSRKHGQGGQLIE
jgi:hypothetical protein